MHQRKVSFHRLLWVSAKLLMRDLFGSWMVALWGAGYFVAGWIAGLFSDLFWLSSADMLSFLIFLWGFFCSAYYGWSFARFDSSSFLLDSLMFGKISRIRWWVSRLLAWSGVCALFNFINLAFLIHLMDSMSMGQVMTLSILFVYSGVLAYVLSLFFNDFLFLMIFSIVLFFQSQGSWIVDQWDHLPVLMRAIFVNARFFLPPFWIASQSFDVNIFLLTFFHLGLFLIFACVCLNYLSRNDSYMISKREAI